MLANPAASYGECARRIQIVAPDSIMRIFYTGMYRAMIQPNLISDSYGSFTAPNGEQQTGPGGKYFSTFSLWDTYRAWNPLMTIIDTTLVSEMLASLIHSFDFYGHLPRWALWGGETHTMIGNHAIPVIVDAYFKGIGNMDAERAYETIKWTSIKRNRLSNWPVYNQYGYLPSDIETTESVSRTLEMAYDDWCVAMMARDLGKDEDYEYFLQRAGFYKNVFDPGTGFMRGRDSHGHWIKEFDPREVTHASSGSGCYTEGNAWQAWKTQAMVRRIMSEMYATDRDGLIGNDDCGQMSAWFILSSLGVYPVNPASGIYDIGSPFIDSAVINVSSNQQFKVMVENQSETNVYIQSVSYNGIARAKPEITHKQIMSGGVLKFVMGDQPNRSLFE